MALLERFQVAHPDQPVQLLPLEELLHHDAVRPRGQQPASSVPHGRDRHHEHRHRSSASSGTWATIHGTMTPNAARVTGASSPERDAHLAFDLRRACWASFLCRGYASPSAAGPAACAGGGWGGSGCRTSAGSRRWARTARMTRGSSMPPPSSAALVLWQQHRRAGVVARRRGLRRAGRGGTPRPRSGATSPGAPKAGGQGRASGGSRSRIAATALLARARLELTSASAGSTGSPG